MTFQSPAAVSVVAAANPGAAITEEAHTMHEGTQPCQHRPVRKRSYAVPDDIGRWQPHEAHAEAIGEHKQAVAAALDLSLPMIERQCRPHNGRGTGKRTDAERMAMEVNALRDLRVDENRAMLSVWWLLDFLGYRRPRPKGGVVITESALCTVGRLACEVADVIREANQALDDGDLTDLERRRIGKEVREAEIAVHDLVIKLRLGASPDMEAA